MEQPDSPAALAHQREIMLFAAALEQPAGSRAVFLDGACHGDPDLRRRLDALLAAHDEPASELAAGNDGEGNSDSGTTRLDEAVGTTIGRYKLLENLGEGGCGAVYVAEQTEPVRRRVALKVIKLGMDTRDVIARFEAERQALALMDHPNIARVLDAGATEAGRPYFVMELVRGIRITDYCDEARLSTAERLNLFINVCHAVQHAHQKGIIHRDLKPSNILVTLHDGVPVPKVIDFGIAKATGERLTNATIYTRLHQFIGTPAYMSPEQAEMSGLDIDTRSDIYSLGVLLYELLTGRTPFDGQELLSAGINHMRRVIREREPIRPSTRLASLQDQELTTVAERRAAYAPKLIHLLRGDLDWIVLKSLEKDRNRRYDAANSLAADLKRHLDHEPVTARPPSMAYRFHKAFRRNRLVYSAATAVGVATVAGAIASYVQANRAWKAEALARAGRAEAEQISQFLQQVFQSPDPEKDGRAVTVAESLDRAAERLETDLAGQPERQARLQTALASTYTSLGLYASALPLTKRVHAYWLATTGPDAAETLDAGTDFVKSLWASGQSRAALPITEDLLERTRRRYGADHTKTVGLVLHYANVLGETGRLTEALKLREANLAAHRKVLGPEHRDTITAMQNLEVNYHLLGMKEKSRPLQEEVVALSRKVMGPDHPMTLRHLGNLAVDYNATKRYAEAIQLLDEVIGKQRRILGPEHPSTLHSMQTLAGSYHESGRTSEALQMREEVLEVTRKSQGPEHPHMLFRMRVLAQSYAAAGRTAQAVKLLEDSIALGLKLHGPEHPELIESRVGLARVCYKAQRFEEAIRFGSEVLPLARKLRGPEHEFTIACAIMLANACVGANRHEEAIPLWLEIVPLRRKTSGPDHKDTLSVVRSLAESCAAAGQYDKAVEFGGEALAIVRKLYKPEQAEMVRTLDQLAYFNYRAGRFGEAVALGGQMVAFSQKTPGPENDETIRRTLQLVKYYSADGKVDQALQLGRTVLGLRQKGRDPEGAATVAALQSVADVYVRHGRWSEARAELLPLMNFKHLPDSATMALMSLAVLDVFLGERSEYEAHCVAMLARFGAVNDPEIANRIAKACLLLPLENDHRKPAVELAAVGVCLGEGSSALSWYLLADALAQCRSGDWNGSVASGERALGLSGRPNPVRAATLHAIIAMARYHLGRSPDARQSLEEGMRLFDEHWPEFAKGIPGGEWHNILMARTLLQEATALIEGTPGSADR